jgi:hypothetical protein
MLGVTGEIALGPASPGGPYIASSNHTIVTLRPPLRVSHTGIVEGPFESPSGMPTLMVSGGDDFLAGRDDTFSPWVVRRFDAFGSPLGDWFNPSVKNLVNCTYSGPSIAWTGASYSVWTKTIDYGLSDWDDDMTYVCHSTWMPDGTGIQDPCAGSNSTCGVSVPAGQNRFTTFVGTQRLVAWASNDEVSVTLRDGPTILWGPIAVGTGGGTEQEPTVAFDGTNFVVAWRDDRNGNPDIYAAWLDQTGAVLDAVDTPISTTLDAESLPMLARVGDGRLAIVYVRAGNARLRFLSRLPLPVGQSCAEAGECASGFCETGLCCSEGCTDDGNECTMESCSTGTCVSMVRTDGAPCTDGTCLDGVCTALPGVGGAGQGGLGGASWGGGGAGGDGFGGGGTGGVGSGPVGSGGGAGSGGAGGGGGATASGGAGGAGGAGGSKPTGSGGSGGSAGAASGGAGGESAGAGGDAGAASGPASSAASGGPASSSGSDPAGPGPAGATSGAANNDLGGVAAEGSGCTSGARGPRNAWGGLGVASFLAIAALARRRARRVG